MGIIAAARNFDNNNPACLFRRDIKCDYFSGRRSKADAVFETATWFFFKGV
jgi:hypothetical protein